MALIAAAAGNSAAPERRVNALHRLVEDDTLTGPVVSLQLIGRRWERASPGMNACINLDVS